MPSPTKLPEHKYTSLFEGLQTEPTSPSPQINLPSTNINLAKSLRQYMRSTLHIGRGTVSPRSLYGIQAQFTVAIDDAYDYKIGANDFDPDTIFPEIITLGNQISEVLQNQLTSGQETAFEDHILHCLAGMVYGSNMIERAGNGPGVTLKLCLAIFRGEEIPEDIGETDEEFLELKRNLLRKYLPANTLAVLRSRREIVQHAKAASYIITQLCIRGQDLSEEIILQTHQILTYKVDAGNTPWKEYSGVYRTDEVCAGLHQFPHHSLVPNKMKAMIRELEWDLKKAINKGTIDPIAIASKYTHIFVNVHPFIDGNGRMCRLILNSILLKLGSFLVCIGDKEEDRSLYMDVACNAGALEDTFGDLDEEEKPVMHKELASFVMSHVKKSMRKLVTTMLR
jgi:fido (protein-threonine AMPylation protein)